MKRYHLLQLIMGLALLAAGIVLGTRFAPADTSQSAKLLSNPPSTVETQVQVSADPGDEARPRDEWLAWAAEDFDEADHVTEELLLEEINILQEEISDLESFAQELQSQLGDTMQSYADVGKPPEYIAEDGSLLPAFLEELEVTPGQAQQVNTLLSWALQEVNLLSEGRQKIKRKGKNEFLIESNGFRKDGNDIKHTLVQGLTDEMGEDKTRELMRKAHREFKDQYHDFGQSSQRVTIQLSPKNSKKKIFISDETKTYLPGNRSQVKIDSGFYNTLPGRYEKMLETP